MVKDSPLPLAHIANKAPSALHENFAEWLRAKTGYEDIDVKSVQLATSLRMVFQRSEENQEDIANRKELAASKVTARQTAAEARLAEKAKRDAERSERAANKGTKGGNATAKAKKAAEVDEPVAGNEDELDDEATPVAPAKPKRSRTRKTATPKVDETNDEVADEAPADETDF